MSKATKFQAWDKITKQIRPVWQVIYWYPPRNPLTREPPIYEFHGCYLGTQADYDYVLAKDLELLEYVGRKDKHGQEVYDGHVIKTGQAREEGLAPFMGHVYWHENELQWWITDDTNDPITGIDYDLTFLNRYLDYEIVGNIYQDSELLEAR